MLKVALKQIENIVIGKIIEQGEEIKRGDFEFESSNGFKIFSDIQPAFFSNVLYIKGTNIEYDNKYFSCIYDNKSQAERMIIYICDAVKEYNQSLIGKDFSSENLFSEKNFIAE